MATKKVKKTKRPKKPNLRKLVKKAFSLWSECARIQHGHKCELCGIKDKEISDKGKPTVLNVHHLIPRGNKALRFDLRNACVLCRNHHKYATNSAHKGSMLFYEWFRGYRPEDYDYLLKSYEGKPIETIEDVQLIIAELESIKEKLQGENNELSV